MIPVEQITRKSMSGGIDTFPEGIFPTVLSLGFTGASVATTNCILIIHRIDSLNTTGAVTDTLYMALRNPFSAPWTYQYFTKLWKEDNPSLPNSYYEVWVLENPTLDASTAYYLTGDFSYIPGAFGSEGASHGQAYFLSGVQAISDVYVSNDTSVIASSNIMDIVLGLAVTTNVANSLSYAGLFGTSWLYYQPTQYYFGTVRTGGGDGALTLLWDTDDSISYNLAINFSGDSSGSYCTECTRRELEENSINNEWKQMLLNIDATVIGLYESNTNTFYASTTSGSSWSSLQVDNYGLAISMSSSGSNIIAPSSYTGIIYYSVDGGENYSQLSNPFTAGDYFDDSCISGDGSIIVVCTGDYQYKYNGVDWTRISPWGLVDYISSPKIRMDSTGNKMIAVGDGADVLYSNNGGSSWTNISSFFTNAYTCDINIDGSIIIVSDDNGINISNDGGASWTNHSVDIGVARIAMDDSGKIILLDGGASIKSERISSEYGVTWAEIYSMQGSPVAFDESATTGISSLYGTLSGDGKFYGVCYSIGQAYVCSLTITGNIKSIAGILLENISKVGGIPIASLKKISGEEN